MQCCFNNRRPKYCLILKTLTCACFLVKLCACAFLNTKCLCGDKYSSSSFRVGTSTVIYTFTDAAGNEAICSFNVNVVSGKKTYPVKLIYC